MYDRSKVRQISVYADQRFWRKVKDEADARHRKIGPAVLEILREYFARKEKQEAEVEVEKAS